MSLSTALTRYALSLRDRCLLRADRLASWPVFDPDAPQVWPSRTKKSAFTAADHAEIARERRAKRRVA